MAQSRRDRLKPKPVADFGHPVAEDDIDRPADHGRPDLWSAPGPPQQPSPAATTTADPAQDDVVSASRPPPAPAAAAQLEAVGDPSAWLGTSAAADIAGYSAHAEPAAHPGEIAHKVRTSDMVPLRIKTRVEADQRRGQEASTIVVLAFKRALDQGVLPGLVAAHKAHGEVASPFAGPHVPARRRRSTPTTRLQYNPWSYEDEGIKMLVQQYDVSRAVLVSLVLAHYYGLSLDIV